MTEAKDIEADKKVNGFATPEKSSTKDRSNSDDNTQANSNVVIDSKNDLKTS